MTEKKDHKMLKKKVSTKYRNRGYSVSEEVRLENGLIVDVVIKNQEEKVGIEVGSLNGEDRIEKLKSYFDRVIHLPQIGKPNVREYSHNPDFFRSHEYKQKSITLTQAHIDVVESKAINLSKYVRNKLEEDFPEEFS
jgi:hypothetical protein